MQTSFILHRNANSNLYYDSNKEVTICGEYVAVALGNVPLRLKVTFSTEPLPDSIEQPIRFSSHVLEGVFALEWLDSFKDRWRPTFPGIDKYVAEVITLTPNKPETIFVCLDQLSKTSSQT